MKSFASKSMPWLAAVAALSFAAPGAAAEVREHPKAVLELFTSQGCSSCPGADALLGQLSTHPDLIALAYHVDYWDYIGWTDTFGAKANSELQRDYAQSWGSSRIYTPQLIVNGVDGVVGSRQSEVDGALAKAALDVPVGLDVSDDMVKINIDARPGTPEAMVWLVTYRNHAEVAIERGENAGRKMDYTQIVTGRQMLGMWDPKTGMQLKLPLSELMVDGADGAVIMVQTDPNGLPGQILGAASVLL